MDDKYCSDILKFKTLNAFLKHCTHTHKHSHKHPHSDKQAANIVENSNKKQAAINDHKEKVKVDRCKTVKKKKITVRQTKIMNTAEYVKPEYS